MAGLGKGVFTVRCDGTGGGEYIWLSGDPTDGKVDLGNMHDHAPQWQFTPIDSNWVIEHLPDGRYLCDGGNSPILGPNQETWIVQSTHNQQYELQSASSKNYMDGNTSNKHVVLTGDPHSGARWTLYPV